jgi:acetoacetyl-CoA synthetase
VNVWHPDPARAAGSRIQAMHERFGTSDFAALHELSVREPDRFWRAVWDECGVIGEPGDVAFEPGDGTMRGARFFTEARLNFAENLLGPSVPGPLGARAQASGGEIALVATDETGRRRELTRRELHDLVARTAAAMRAEGVQPGDRVAAWMANIPETVAIMLAAASIGAVFSSTSPDFGVAGVVDRFGQIEPVLLFAVDGYQYGGKRFDCTARLGEIAAALPSVRRVVVVRHLDEGSLPDGAVAFDEWASPGSEPVVPSFAPLPFDHPLAVLYSSGTTGPPKCIVHRAGGVLVKHLSEHQLHCDVRAGDRVFYFTTCGWMMWNWLVSALASRATIVLYDGSPFHPDPNALFELAARERVTLFGVSAKFIDACRKEGLRPRDTHDLSSVATVCSTGSPLVAESFEFVWDAVSPTAHLASISGGTDLCGCLVIGDPTRAVYAGEIQGPALGVAADVWTEAGEPAAVGVTGELVCTRPFPSMPLGFWGDTTGARYQAAYFDRFPGARPSGREPQASGGAGDIWSHGDFAARTEHGGFVISGRSDATLNPGGVRIGTAEIYRQVEALPEVAEALAISRPAGSGDTEIVLFVRLTDGAAAIDSGVVRTIKERLRTRCSPRHVPARIVAVADLPRTRSGKLAELAVADVVAGRTVRNREALANPEALDQFEGLLD